MIEAHLLKLRIRDEIGSAEEAAIRQSVAEVRTVPDGTTVVRAGEELSESLLLIDGWMARARDLADGKRQITELHVAGDFADLHSFTLKRLDHDVVALSRCRLAVVPHERLREITERFPHLTRVYWFSTNLDAAIHREWAVSLGRRPALARLAHLFCELHVRLGIVGLVEDDAFDFPLTQDELGECLGLTPVHINRTLQELRAKGLIRLEERRLQLCRVEELTKLAGFDPAYLYLRRLGL